jgi:hypothetical protein
MDLQVFGFFPTTWIEVPPGNIRLRLDAAPPVLANAGVRIEEAPLLDDHTQQHDWKIKRIGKVDNSVDTAEVSDTFEFTARANKDYRIRFEGNAVLGMLGFNQMELGCSIVGPTGNVIDPLGGAQPLKATGAAVMGCVFVRCRGN